jgi:hypothetical protein
MKKQMAIPKEIFSKSGNRYSRPILRGFPSSEDLAAIFNDKRSHRVTTLSSSCGASDSLTTPQANRPSFNDFNAAQKRHIEVNINQSGEFLQASPDQVVNATYYEDGLEPASGALLN